MDFKDKSILVIGGSSGIGLALVNSLSSMGAIVYNVSRNPSASWKGNVKHLSFDVLNDLSSLAVSLPDQLHGLVYAVGSINLKPFNRLSVDDFVNDYNLNVLGAVKVIHQSLKALKNAKSSSIVLMSTVAVATGMSFHASIASAKGAIEGLGMSLASELAPQQIRVNVVAPSLTDTPLSRNLLSTPEKQELSAKRHPLGRYGKPEDIASLINFLLSDDSSWMTGQIIGIDGGMGNLK
jgi:3-oxoacyl-[acyl-carrier protein] reductase